MSFCPTCGTRIEMGNRFCTQCGAVVDAAPVPPPNAGGPTGSPFFPPGGGAAVPPPFPPPSGVAGRSHRPLLALVLALLIPGGGQAYNGQPVKGFFLLFLSVLVLPWLYSLYDAWAGAHRIAISGGRFGRGGLVWVFLQAWLAINVVLFVLLALTLRGTLT